MTIWVAVDLGTSSTCVAVAVDQQDAQVVIIDGGPLMSSAIYTDGRSVFVGAEAQRQAALDPARFEPHPKRRIDEGSLLLGSTVLSVEQALAAVLGRAVAEARAVLSGAPVDHLVLTHPAEWAGVRSAVLLSAAAGLAADTVLIAEPVAAAVAHGANRGPGALLAVLDVGAGTTDISVLRRHPEGWHVLATGGDPDFGGADVDQAILEHLGAGLHGDDLARWDALVHGQELVARRGRRAFVADVRSAKETLSRHAYADLPLLGELPDAHLARTDLEELIGPRVASVVDLLADMLARAGAVEETGRTSAEVVLVGGSSRIPLIARMVHERLGVLAVLTDQPDTAVARGALLAMRPAPPHPPAPMARDPAGTLAVPRRQPRRGRRAALLAAAGSMIALVVVTVFAVRDDAPAARTVQAQYASLQVPAGWREAERSENGATARLVLTPGGGASEPERLLLVQTRLTAGATITEVADVLAAKVAEQQQAGQGYDAFDPAARYAGRAVLRYSEVPQPGSVVYWFVVVEGSYQLSVGCQQPQGTPYTADKEAVCQQAVRTAQVTPR